jgi:hypothetical protein
MIGVQMGLRILYPVVADGVTLVKHLPMLTRQGKNCTGYEMTGSRVGDEVISVLFGQWIGDERGRHSCIRHFCSRRVPGNCNA